MNILPKLVIHWYDFVLAVTVTFIIMKVVYIHVNNKKENKE